MKKKSLIIYIYVIILTLILFVFLTQMIYAEETQKFNGYNPGVEFENDYEYKLLEYSFLSREKTLIDYNFRKRFAYINQNGNWNESSVSQFGNFGSIVDVIQIGNENKATVKQFANFTKSEVFQFGNNHDLSIEQWRSEGKIYVIQSGNNLEDKEIKIVQF